MIKLNIKILFILLLQLSLNELDRFFFINKINL